MIKEKVYGSTKRFGTRYGRSLKRKLGKIEQIQRSKHKCPYCHALKVRRLCAGIWYCEKCKAKFTGKAYSLMKIELEEGEEAGSKETSKKEEI